MRRTSLLAAAPSLLIASSVALAQTTPAPGDSVARDPVRADTVPRDSLPPRPIHQMQAVLYAFALAPAALQGIIPPDSTERGKALGYARDHLSLYVAGGLASGTDGPVAGAAWTGAGSVELLARGIAVEGRVQQFRLPGQVEYRTLRVGRMSRSRGPMTGGVTLGYREVRELRKHEGVEVGFPFVAGGRRGWVRMESAYVLSLRQSSWNYRLLAERRLGDSPLTVGCGVDLLSWEIRNHGRLSHGAFSLGLGTAYWRRGRTGSG